MAFFKRSPKPDYLSEFNGTYSWLVDQGPSTSGEVRAWGSPAPTFSARAFAANWRTAELEDGELAAKTPGPYFCRVSALSAGLTGYVSADPDARKVYLQLGEQLYDAGALEAPYNENLWDDPDDTFGSSPGKARLYTLMYLTIYATELGHPRAAQWISQAREGLAATPEAEPTLRLAEWWSRIA